MNDSVTLPERRSTSGLPRVFTILLNWNGLEDTIECLESLKTMTYGNLKIIVVDNGSGGGEADDLEIRYGNWITVLRNRENLGYAEANNIGIRYALERDAKYVLLLNNDTVVSPDFLNRMIEVAESRQDFGILGPMIYYYPPNRGGETIWFAGGRVIRCVGQPLHLGLKERDQGQFDRTMIVDYITGCALLIKKDVIKRIGLLDNDYFAYFEDLDWNIRARKAGYNSVFVPNAKIWHKASATTGHLSPIHTYLMTRNRILFARMNLDRISFSLVFLPYLLCVRIPRDIVRVARKRGGIKSIFSGLEDGFSGRLRFVGGLD